MHVWDITTWNSWDWLWSSYMLGYGLIVAVAGKNRAPWWVMTLLILGAYVVFVERAWC